MKDWQANCWFNLETNKYTYVHIFNDYLIIYLKKMTVFCLSCYYQYEQVSSISIITQTRIYNIKQFNESVKLAHGWSYINLALES